MRSLQCRARKNNNYYYYYSNIILFVCCFDFLAMFAGMASR
jgi:hypothetical protein